MRMLGLQQIRGKQSVYSRFPEDVFELIVENFK
ncbi:hypothetical protein SVI_2499 [Shewanella violacea DSS12]|uniref:Uncharacterized protein n=1 Tax=Shewanella violacea (strain JCM 10179 / CIP 106290 / LMG 19151 / DSS12) TaxID=637905 RepID=D4ZLC1_SHEVD|nr:hypothetical protein SVI_2499 [Shewanella violacea DSS12]